MKIRQPVVPLVFSFLFLPALFSFFLPLSTKRVRSYDLCVYGETPAGITAAIQAARMGKSVLLVSTNDHVGGMATSGLTATDLNNFRIASGITKAFYQKIYAHYLQSSAWKAESRATYFERSKKRTYSGKNDSLRIQWVYESSVGEHILREMLKEAGVEVLFKSPLDLKKKPMKENRKIQRIWLQNGVQIAARMFIDASYEGDLLHMAGVSYKVGREPNSQYEETMNGIRLGPVVGRDSLSIDPYIRPGDPSSGLLPYIDPSLSAPEGSGDGRTQSYCYRMTLTDDDSNRIPINKSKGYKPLLYEFLARYISLNPGIQLHEIISFTPMPNKKTDTNQGNFVGMSYAWPQANHEERKKIALMHKEYILGLFWFLGNDPRVPDTLRKEMKRWGLPKDEYPDTGNFPYQLYVREARRMVGDYVMTERNCTGAVSVKDPIAVATYPLDCHFVARVVDQDGKVRVEGSYGKQKATNYTISYQSIVPKSSEVVNLLVPVCLSASHVAYSSIRMEPVYMVLGQSAGTAAAIALDQNIAVQDVDYRNLSKRLMADGQVLSLAKK